MQFIKPKHKAFVLAEALLGLTFISLGIMLVACNQQVLVRRERQVYAQLNQSYQQLNWSRQRLYEVKEDELPPKVPQE
ncbi:hypothetical protein [Ligilactobacillus saerimneri]|uniref:Type II secretion system protein n=1 Tax=Ligilactobacillus saerimneri TaxID=228229 RepID=A0A7H9EJF0_9LACO|nr:hypothetical protein [Ligilactobacillus saerimneri]MBU5310081.1 hypothetical protein [Ligilactobacillus saerimneri]MCZ0891008.1 hypothetical protein [Ligilactobacillus saerimneri]MDI9206722.1 hypothetical protein [Ligilactobacillus saerimneri]MDY4003302.1 hypothetical protein [Ligilactobacillus saerimneri]QLL77569.1 hypothetical protein GTO87_02395 [Ligilactobacillus saerimneri]